MSLSASKKMSQMTADAATWEDRQLMRSGVVRSTGELSTEIDDEDENRVMLLFHGERGRVGVEEDKIALCVEEIDVH